MPIRDRGPDDVAACAAILARTHNLDGYPRCQQNTGPAFVVSDRELGAWVAVTDELVVGHVALHDSAGDACFALAHHATGLAAEELAVVARLAVDPDHRQRRIGSQLLTHAVSVARSVGRRAVLDVVTDSPLAQQFYERAGWIRVGETVIPIPEVEDLAAYVYISPQPG